MEAQTIVFLIITLVGFVYLLLSLLVGELSDVVGALHLDFLTHGLNADHSGADDSPGLTDSRVMATFLTAFGAIGMLTSKQGVPIEISLLSAFIGGVCMGTLVYVIAKLVYSQQSNSSVGNHDLLGKTGEITVPIQTGNLGMVVCRIGDERIEKLARSINGVNINAGTPVSIISVEGEFVIVEPKPSTQQQKDWRQ